jgi:hypothetical protein
MTLRKNGQLNQYNGFWEITGPTKEGKPENGKKKKNGFSRF